MKNTFLYNEQGLTLIELMIVLTLSLLLMAAVYMTFQLQHKSGQVQFQIAATQQDLRAVMEIISTDIQNAGYNIDPNTIIQGIADGTTGSGATILRVRQMNADITYSLNSNSLQRTDNNTLPANPNHITVLASNVSILGFKYWGIQADGTRIEIVPNAATGTLDAGQGDSVRFVEVSITVQSNKIDPDTGKLIPARSLNRTVCRRNGIPL